MRRHILSQFRVVFALCLLLTFVSGCEKKMADPQGTLKKEAERYWTERLINKNFKYTYELELKEGLPSFETYDKKLKIVTRIPTRSLKVEEVKVDGKDGSVKILAKCQIMGAPTLLDIPMGDRWGSVRGRWKHVPQIKFV